MNSAEHNSITPFFESELTYPMVEKMEWKEHEVVIKIYRAKNSMHHAEELILSSMPFIRAQVSKYLNQPVFDNSLDEVSIAMIAFHEAIQSYQKDKGAFFAYAALLIRSRLVDYTRSQSKHVSHISLDAPVSDENDALQIDRFAHTHDHSDQILVREATLQEIEELAEQLKTYGLTFSDIASNAPKQNRSKEACQKILSCARKHSEVLDELVHKKRLPLKKLCEIAQVDRKTAERHRRYLVGLLLIYTNGYEILRSHLVHISERSVEA